jgi:hypothetical protein
MRGFTKFINTVKERGKLLVSEGWFQYHLSESKYVLRMQFSIVDDCNSKKTYSGNPVGWYY